MKLRTKLLIVFISVMILPTIFTSVAMQTFAPERENEIQQMYLMIVFLTTRASDLLDLPGHICSAGEASEGGAQYPRRETWILRSSRIRMMRSGSSVRILRRCASV